MSWDLSGENLRLRDRETRAEKGKRGNEGSAGRVIVQSSGTCPGQAGRTA